MSRRLALTVIATVLVAFLSALPVPAQDGPRSGSGLQDIAAEATEAKARTAELLARGAAAQEAEKKRLQEELAAVRETAARSRSRAQELEEQLRVLRQADADLVGQNADQGDGAELVQSVVAANARMLQDELLSSVLALSGTGSERVRELARQDVFPGFDDVADLLLLLEDAIDASGRVVRRREQIVDHDGSVLNATVLRLGSFQAVYADGHGGGFLLPSAGSGMLRAAPRRSEGRELEAIRAAMADVQRLPLDFSAGAVPAKPLEQRTLLSRLEQGGRFIWPILFIGLIGLVLILERCVVLGGVRLADRNHAGTGRGKAVPGRNCPARRVVDYMLADGPASAEKLEMRMEEAVLAELPRLERFLQTLRVMAAVAPLLGLLGTVSGIIQTFRVIAVHGNGDPKLLSSGISEALLTTEMGLIVAIPLLLCHHFLSRRVSAVVLDMEVAGAAVISAGREARP